jgi:hypothetical protein
MQRNRDTGTGILIYRDQPVGTAWFLFFSAWLADFVQPISLHAYSCSATQSARGTE